MQSTATGWVSNDGESIQMDDIDSICRYPETLATSAISELLEFDDQLSETTMDRKTTLDTISMKDDISTEIYEIERYKDPTCYFEDGKTIIDCVLVYEENVNHGTKSESKAEKRRQAYRMAFERKLEDIGLKLEYEVPEQSNIKDTAVVKIHATWEFLTKLADMAGMRTPLAETDIELRSSIGKLVNDCFSSMFAFWSIPKSFQLPFKEYYYAKFEKKFEQAYHIDSKRTFFSTIQRLKLVNYAMERITIKRVKTYSAYSRQRMFYKHKGEGGKNHKNRSRVVGTLTISDLCNKGIYQAWYPLHDSGLEMGSYSTMLPDRLPLRAWLYEYWARYRRCFTSQPLDEIREYFGEEIAMYFAWLGLYTQMLIFPTILSVACFCYGLYVASTSSVVREICETTSLHDQNETTSYDFLHTDNQIQMCRLCPHPTCPYKPLQAECSNARIAMMFDHMLTSVYAIFMSLWTILFLTIWERKQSYLSFRWDTMMRDQQEDILRPEYKLQVHTTVRNPATNKVEVRMRTKEKLLRLLASISFCIGFVILVISVLIGIQIYKLTSTAVYYKFNNKYIRKIGASTVASVSGSIMNALFIAITNMMWSNLAWKLTEFENPKTQKQFEKSYIYKVVLFQFINFYGLLLYMALLKGKTFSTPDKQSMSSEQCPPVGCLPEIIIQLIIIMTGKQILNNIIEVLQPLIMNFWRKRGIDKNPKTPNTFSKNQEATQVRWEEDFTLLPMTLPVAYADYLEMIIQYGFLTMFAAAFPPAAIFALINNVIEIRLDAQHYLSRQQRIRPCSAVGIGPWKTILVAFTRIAIVVNAITLAFTTQFVERLVYRLAPLSSGVVRTCLGDLTQDQDQDESSFEERRNHLEGYLNWRITKFNTSLYRALYEEPTNDTGESSLLSRAVSHATSHFDSFENLTRSFSDFRERFGFATGTTTADHFLEEMQNNTDPITGLTTKVETCYFIGLFMQSAHGDYHHCPDFWYVLVAQLTFVVLFEHLVVLSQTVIRLIINRVPSQVQEHIQREVFLQNELFIRHEHEMIKKAEEEAAKQSKLKIKRAKRLRRWGNEVVIKTIPTKTPIRLRGFGRKKRAKKATTTNRCFQISSKNFDTSENNNDLTTKYSGSYEPESRKVRPKGYVERSNNKMRHRRKPFWLRFFQKLNYYC